LWRKFERSKALRVVFVGFGGWEMVAGRDVDLEVGGFVAGELLVDGGEGAEEQAGDVGESGGAAGGDLAASEETKEMGEGMVDALGGLKVFGALGEKVGEVLGVGGWRFGVAGAELGLRVQDEASALASGGGVVLATFGSAGGFGVSFSVRVRCFHGRSFLGSNFISKKFNLGRGGTTPFFPKRGWKTLKTKKTERAKRGTTDCARGLEVAGAKFEPREAGNLETGWPERNAGARGVVR
jgi:hypothetical protein